MNQIAERLVGGAMAERLAAFPRFAQLAPRTLSLLVAAGDSRSLQVGESILEEGKPSRSMFIALSGRLKMTRALPNGRSALLALFGAGDPIGISSLGGRPSQASVEAIEAAVCLEVSHRRLLAAMEASPSLVGDLLPVFAEQIAECRNCVMEGAFYRTEQRFARILLKLAQSIGRSSSGSIFVPVALSRQDLADMAGTTIETSIRIMSRWGKAGMVETRSDGFCIRDLPSLEGKAGD